MANKIKNKNNTKPADPEKLKVEEEEQVTLKEIARDERTRKIIGTIFVLLSIFLFLAFTSYLFTWQEDESDVQQESWKYLTNSEAEPASNLLGRLGAFTAYHFMKNGFGLAAYLFCSLFFVLGVNLVFERKVFSVLRNVKYLIIGLIFFPFALAFFTKGSDFSWGGAMGNYINDYVSGFLGKIGAGAIIVTGAFVYFIWRFNPVFKLPAKKIKNTDIDVPTSQVVEATEQQAPVVLHDVNTVKEDPKPNALKEDAGILINFPQQEEEEESSTDFTVIEKDIPEEMPPVTTAPVQELQPTPEAVKPVVNEMVSVIPPKSAATASSVITVAPPAINNESSIELEIKSVPLETAEPVVAETKVQQMEPYDPALDLRDFKLPHLNLLDNHGNDKIVHDAAELEAHKNQIINTLKNYDIAIQKITATVGPTVTLYEIVPAAGVRISRIKNLEDDIALSLAALGIRIIAPIPGKGTIGIEVPNIKKSMVSMRTLLASEKFKNSTYALPIALGKKIDNENFIADLANMPHLLMAGATGQGKSVGLNAILVSLLYKKHPSQLKFVLIDPKKVELSLYRAIEKHYLAKLPGEDDAIITDTKKVIHTLNALCIEMDNRYDLLKEAGTRNLREYNEKFIARKLNPQKGHQYLPYIVLVVDEFADLIMTAGKEIEMPIARLAQLARAVGIHLIIATQRPSVNIITGTIKANFPARIAFKVSSKIDSRTILDIGGAEQLIGKGDMLISYGGELVRLQCAFVDTPEVENICEYIGKQRGYPQPFYLPEYVDEKDTDNHELDLNDRDPLFEDAARMIVQNQMGSTSLIQRRMKLGYNRAGRLMDQLEAAGVVGKNAGSKAREVLIKTEAELDQLLNNI
jgi:S-DNA-T family DNA segregation ATPase FtsK/SpoIIIE